MEGPALMCNERETFSVKKKIVFIVFIFVCALTLLFGCGNGGGNAAYRDGVFTGKSGGDDRGAYGEATITVKDNKITDCRYVTWQKDGTMQDVDYGKVNGEISSREYYDKAQLAVRAMEQYAEKLVEVQELAGVDAVSGATIAFDQFNEAVGDALAAARE
jgi:major membrane immunogen (membrane-anchored lipoprotein)